MYVPRFNAMEDGEAPAAPLDVVVERDGEAVPELLAFRLAPPRLTDAAGLCAIPPAP
jgi:hypothetical protein